MEELLMKVNLISVTTPFGNTPEHVRTAEDLVAYCARVSSPANQTEEKPTGALLDYLVTNNHWSPFEMVNLCLEIETTRDIARQILRHRSFTFQEFSQRYADPTKLSFVMREPRMQDVKNRQNSLPASDKALEEEWYQKQAAIMEQAKRVYVWAVGRGIAKEVARAILPEGITTSRMYMNGSLRSWIHYIEVRTGNGTQKEHIEVAKACAKEIEKIYPSITKFVREDR